MMPSNDGLLAPWWSLALPPLMLVVMLMSPPERHMPAALLAAAGFAALQWLLPGCRVRSGNYLSPVNVALFLIFLKLLVLPAIIMLRGPEIRLLAFQPTYESMQRALLVDLVAAGAFCLGLTYAPREQATAGWILRGPEPSRWWAMAFAAIGLVGLAAVFGSPAGMLDYFVAEDQVLAEAEGSLQGAAGTFLRPFLAFGLVAWWSRRAREGVAGWRVGMTWLLAAAGITLVNMTFHFNRAAFVFPVLCLVAVYGARVRRIRPAWFAMAAAVLLPVLIGVGMLRSSRMIGGTKLTNTWWETMSDEIVESLHGYASGPQLTALYCDSIGWGDQLAGGSTLLASAMSPVPILGKPFRDGAGPALYNKAIYGINDVADQILPFDIELFANFHLPGVMAGFVLLGMLLGWGERWFAAAESIFLAFCVQYIFLWVAMLAAWSVAIFSQMVVYFFCPVYCYVVGRRLLAWWRKQPMTAPEVLA